MKWSLTILDKLFRNQVADMSDEYLMKMKTSKLSESRKKIVEDEKNRRTILAMRYGRTSVSSYSTSSTSTSTTGTC